MVGIRRKCCTGTGSDSASMQPYFMWNGWMLRKRIEKGNSDYNTMEVGDYVVDGLTEDSLKFEGEWLGDLTGNGIHDLNNYNTPMDIELSGDIYIPS